MKDFYCWTIIKYIVVGLLITAILVLLKINVEKSNFGRSFELFTYEQLQNFVPSHSSLDKLPVVVDTSNYPQIKVGSENYTDREKLIETIISISEQKPRAIGVDIIFSLQNGKWRTQFDEEFLESCLKISEEKGIPIFLGVDTEMKTGNPAAWLGSEKFKEMAVSIAVSKNKNDSHRFLLWARDQNQTEKLPSMGFALAEAERKQNSKNIQPPRWLNWAIETVDGFPGRKNTENGVEYVDALLNLSKLKDLEVMTLPLDSSKSIEEFGKDFLRNRIVILGDGGNSDISANGTRGVYIHASATYTLLREPIYEFKGWVRILVDFTIPLIVFIIIAFKRWKNRNISPPYKWSNRQRLIFGIGCFCISIFAII
ncbi:MAG TPA: CHASE2 domain-containing protein, partial [Candidatus Nitrosocosmicus sp.]|nr:CHASE2 domain-containing protein [Candidatus Nitrosocosmicus sp.]